VRAVYGILSTLLIRRSFPNGFASVASLSRQSVLIRVMQIALLMRKIHQADVDRLSSYIHEITSSNPKRNMEIDLGGLAKLMSNVLFDGPINKRGSGRAFSHELLKDQPMLTDGTFSVHIFNPKTNTIIYHDFKKYMLPHIEIVLALLETNNLIEKGGENV
jgi:hypothetical protein